MHDQWHPRPTAAGSCALQTLEAEARNPASKARRMTIKDVNDSLDSLAGVRTQPRTPGATPGKAVSQVAASLANLITRAFPDELPALFTIILQGKHERNISADNFLRVMHQDALEVYKTCAPPSPPPLPQAGWEAQKDSAAKESLV